MIQIAVCDDNPTIRLKIIELLKEYALSQSLGIELKQMDGLGAAAHIREEDAIVPLIFVTS